MAWLVVYYSARKARAIEKQKILDAKKTQKVKEAAEKAEAKKAAEVAKTAAKEAKESERKAAKEVGWLEFFSLHLNEWIALFVAELFTLLF